MRRGHCCGWWKPGEARAGVDEGEDIASDAIADALYGIASELLHGGGRDALGTACFAGLAQWLVSSAAIQPERCVAHLIGLPGDDASDSGDTGDGHLWVWHQVLMNTDKGSFPRFGWTLRRRRISSTTSRRKSAWRRRLGARERGVRAAGASPAWVSVLLPAVEGAAADLEGIAGGGATVGLPEAQDVGSFLGMSIHVPTMPDFGDAVKPSYSVANMLDLHGISSWVEECHMYLNLCTTKGAYQG